MRALTIFQSEEIAQSKTMHDTCFLCSLVYNICLAERKESYDREGNAITAYGQINSGLRRNRRSPGSKGSLQVLQDVPRRGDYNGLICTSNSGPKKNKIIVKK